MPILVQKYGGSSVADLDKIRGVARAVARRRADGFDVVVVVSAMGSTTDDLLGKARALSQNPPRRELDMLLSTGERISSALLAIALHEQGVEAVSLTGSQCGIITSDRHVDARIIEVRPVRIQDELARGHVVIVAGFQGMSYRRDITTLGRGGSDTTAVALAAALSAEACEIYSDVDGVWSADPRLAPAAHKIDVIGYPEMQELACAGAKVLNAEAVEFAKRAGIALYARQTGSPSEGTLVRVDPPAAAGGVRGIAHRLRMLVLRAADAQRDALLAVLQAQQVRSNFVAWLGDHQQAGGVAPTGTPDNSPCCQGGGRGGFTPLGEGAADAPSKEATGPRRPARDLAGGLIEVWCARDNLHGEAELRTELTQAVPGLTIDDSAGAVSLIGEGILDDPRHLQQALATLAELGAPARALATSSFRISLLLDSARVADAVRALHHRFLDAEAVAVSPDF